MIVFHALQNSTIYRLHECTELSHCRRLVGGSVFHMMDQKQRHYILLHRRLAVLCCLQQMRQRLWSMF